MRPAHSSGTVPTTLNQVVAQGAPQASPTATGRVPGGQALGDGHRLTGRDPRRDLQGDRSGIEGGPDALVQHTLEAGFDQCAIVMHERSLRRIGGGWRAVTGDRRWLRYQWCCGQGEVARR